MSGANASPVGRSRQVIPKAALLTFLCLIGVCSWLLLARAASDQDAPEFFFTRLAYSERDDGCCRHGGGGGRGGFGGFGFRRGTMPVPRTEFVCPEFGGGNFFPPQGWGW